MDAYKLAYGICAHILLENVAQHINLSIQILVLINDLALRIKPIFISDTLHMLGLSLRCVNVDVGLGQGLM